MNYGLSMMITGSELANAGVPPHDSGYGICLQRVAV